MIEVEKIGRYKKGCYLVIWKRYSPCMCSHTRHSKVIYAEKKPTVSQVIKQLSE